ncbi:MAG: UDP-N-acetylmuramoyl-L-alanine--D-glutamate ligase [Amoebophilaceae bacterium]|jgi:UDP-N-acetylmuramoylalanine--D-glutamate ligase|nr:UDP-N-acetylmuramoyl-L-alanine--D-glutamate ligase [Amoebophilaceae bacterium]
MSIKKIAILGAGESGTGAALLAQAKGLSVFVSDAGEIAAPYKEALTAHKIVFEERQHSQDTILEAHEIVKSPGIPDSTPIIKTIHKRGIPIIAEIELASRYTQASLIGVTGTNGKTTTTHLTYHLLKEAGLDVDIVGNVGTSFARKVLEKDRAYYVLELSSFQLEGMYSCKLAIACLLNITPDHLDRYQGQMEPYIQAKFNMLRNMTSKDHFIYNQEDINIQTYRRQHTILPHQHPVSIQHSIEANVSRSILDTANCQLLGKHNRFNTLVALKVAQILGIDTAQIQTGLTTFKGIPHRIEWVTQIDGVHFYNDSKGTNVAATYAALMSFSQPIVWIAGGVDKGNDYTTLQTLSKTRVKAMVCLGKDNTKLHQAFQQLVAPIHETQHMEEAVEIALTLAKPAGIVLLSPACASFDLFKNFEERGERFKQAVLHAQSAQDKEG